MSNSSYTDLREMNDEGLKLILEDAADNLFNEDPYCQQGGGEGVIIAQGGKFAGWNFYMKHGQVSYLHNGLSKAYYTGMVECLSRCSLSVPVQPVPVQPRCSQWLRSDH